MRSRYLSPWSRAATCQRGGDPPCDAFGGGKTIARLEARLGVALFQRTTRRQLLTEEGEQFYLQCREALERIREAEETLQRGKDEVQGRLRVSLPVLSGQRCVAPLLFRLSQRHPLPKPRAPLQRPAGQSAGGGSICGAYRGAWPIPGRCGPGRWESTAWCCARRRSTCASSQRRRLLRGLNEHRTLGYLHNGQLQNGNCMTRSRAEARSSPQTWLIQDDFAAIAAAGAAGRHRLAAGLAGGAGASRWDVAAGAGAQRSVRVSAIHAVWPEGAVWPPQKRGRRIDALREALPSYRNTLVSAERK